MREAQPIEALGKEEHYALQVAKREINDPARRQSLAATTWSCGELCAAHAPRARRYKDHSGGNSKNVNGVPVFVASTALVRLDHLQPGGVPRPRHAQLVLFLPVRLFLLQQGSVDDSRIQGAQQGLQGVSKSQNSLIK